MSSPRRYQLFVVSVLAIFLSETSAQAATVTSQQVKSIDFKTTGFNDSLVFEQFNPASGSLNSVELILEGRVRGSLGLENRADVAKTFTATLVATLTLRRPDGSTLLTVSPEDNRIVNLSAADNVIDFGGTSGVLISGLTGNSSRSYLSATPPSASDLALFSGTGNFTLTVGSGSLARDNAGGELSGRILADAAATATLRYTFTTPNAPEPQVIPEPSSFVLLGIGGGFSLVFGHWRRRSRRNVA